MSKNWTVIAINKRSKAEMEFEGDDGKPLRVTKEEAERTAKMYQSHDDGSARYVAREVKE